MAHAEPGQSVVGYAVTDAHLGDVQQGCSRGVEASIHLSHACAHGGKVLHGLAALVISQVALEGILHRCQVRIRHGCTVLLLQCAANLLHQICNLHRHTPNFNWRDAAYAAADGSTEFAALAKAVRSTACVDPDTAPSLRQPSEANQQCLICALASASKCCVKLAAVIVSALQGLIPS